MDQIVVSNSSDKFISTQISESQSTWEENLLSILLIWAYSPAWYEKERLMLTVSFGLYKLLAPLFLSMSMFCQQHVQ